MADELKSIPIRSTTSPDRWSERSLDHSGRKTCPDCGGTFTHRNRGEDGRCAPCTWPDEIKSLQKLESLKRLAQVHTDMVFKVINARPGYHWMWRPEDAAFYARQAYRCCMKYQIEGGK